MSVKEWNQLDEISRRKFMNYAAKALLGVGINMLTPSSELLGQNIINKAPKAKNLIYLYMAGGVSHIDTFDIKPKTSVQGPVEAIRSKGEIGEISGYLPKTAKVMDKVAVIRSLHSTQGAHEQGNYYMRTSYTLRNTIKHPGMGTWLNKVSGRTNSTLPGNIRIGGSSAAGGAGFFEAKYGPVYIGDPQKGLANSTRHHSLSEEQFRRRLELSQWMDLAFHGEYKNKDTKAYADLYQEAAITMDSEDLKSFDISKEDKDTKDKYGNNTFGLGCLLARRLVENQVRSVEVNLGGWDTHFDNFERTSNKCSTLDSAFSTLIEDLDERGLLSETLVVLATEFGRDPKINEESGGRGHHPQAFTGILAGGGIRPGITYGKTDELAQEIVENKVEVPDFNATIAYALGLPLKEKFFSDSGRPFTVASKGKPVLDLFA